MAISKMALEMVKLDYNLSQVHYPVLMIDSTSNKGPVSSFSPIANRTRSFRPNLYTTPQVALRNL